MRVAMDQSSDAGKALAQERGREWARKQATKAKTAKMCFTCGGPHYARSCPLSVCHWCAKTGHLARECQFGKTLLPADQFVLCSASQASEVCCFARRFIMPLHRASPDFDPDKPLDEGRVDVGCRTVTAALFRSEAYRRNTEVRLVFGGDGSTSCTRDTPQPKVAVIAGGLVRGLQPHEQAVATRIRQCLNSAPEDCPVFTSQDDSPSPGDAGRGPRHVEGLRCMQGDFEACLEDSLRHCDAGSPVVVLSESGTPVLELMHQLQARLSPPQRGCGAVHQVTIVLGDHRGLTATELDTTSRVVKQASCELMHCSLGPVTLLGSHCITLFHHYLDSYLHHCPDKLFEVHPQVSKSRKQAQQRPRARPSDPSKCAPGGSSDARANARTPAAGEEAAGLDVTVRAQ